MAIKGAIPDQWLMDAPLFIDEQLIKSLYNAVALPEYEDDPEVTISTKDVKVVKWSAGGEIEAEPGGLWKAISPIKPKVKVKGDLGRDKTDETQHEWKLRKVATPERRLTNLAVFYSANLSPEHVWTVNGLDDDLSWIDEASPRDDNAPKSLIFLDVKPGFPIVPMAAELDKGKVVTFYDEIAPAGSDAAEVRPPEYPNSDVERLMPDYWSWFDRPLPDGGDASLVSMKVMEDKIGDKGRPRWINCRVPLGKVGAQTRSLHLNIKGREMFDTGDFAYGFVRRGRRHGYRLVGILKTGPALNVLAIYEK